MKCQNEYCEAELKEHCDYEEHSEGADEDKGWIVDIYEVFECDECGYASKKWIGDRPA